MKTKLSLPNKLTSYADRARHKIQRSLGWRYATSIDDIIEILKPYINDYVDWYAERGLYLPEEFKSDPAAWTNKLRKIQRAFDLVEKKEYKDNVKLKEEVDEGLQLFGKYFLELWK